MHFSKSNLLLIVASFFLIACGGGGGETTPTPAPVINAAPIAIAQSVTLNENQTLTITLAGTDANGDSLTYNISINPSHGSFSNGVYTPNPHFVGNDSFAFVANDGSVNSQPATVSITVMLDTDGDNIADVTDPDDDNDGFTDIDETTAGTDPLDATSKPLDTDGDNVSDVNDAFPNDPSESVDTDSDGIGNNADTDDDNDGVPDNNDAFPLDASESIDTDNDGIGNNADKDDDNDGFTDIDETTAGSDPLDANSIPIIRISGTITYDLVPPNSNHIGLNYNAIRQEKAKLVVVEAIDASGTILKSTTTDENGAYVFSGLPAATNVKIRVLAQMKKLGTPSWDVKVINQNNGNALYAMDGILQSTGVSDSTRDLNAPSGWTGAGYGNTRTAAPFAILDAIDAAMSKVLSAEANATFPPLVVYWYAGSTDGTYYTNNELHIFGDENLDTDEYDNHIIAHEWGHYYEDKFSRSDSLGGSHSNGEHLDIRVAFSEGFANAFSGIALEDPVYFDTKGSQQNNGFSFNVESEIHDTPGWFSEASIQRIVYDLYDSSDDGKDTLSLGFAPLHQVFTTKQKNSPAFTSIFNFITYLKETTSNTALIDKIVGDENIATINDIWGSNRTNNATLYPYYELTVGGTVSIKTSNSENNLNIPLKDRDRNKLDNRQLVKFTISTAGSYTIKVQQTNGADADPDFYLYKGSPLVGITNYLNGAGSSEEHMLTLDAGDYVLDVTDYNNLNDAQFNVTIN
jgi:hypothetical protein